MSEQNQVKKEEVAVEKVESNTVSNNKKMFLIGLLALLGLALVVIVGITLYRVYRVSADDRFTVTVARGLHLPAGKVNGKVITYADYMDDLRAIRIARESAKAANAADATQTNPVADYTDEQLSEQVYWRLATNILSDKAASDLGVKVDPKEVDDQKTKVVEYYKTIQGADEGLQKEYGWNLSQFLEKVIKPYVLQNKLAQVIANDTTRKSATLERAQEALTEIQGGLSFDDAVKKYSEDASGAANGEWGEATKEQLAQFSPELSAMVAQLKDGEIGKNLITLQDGLHIVQLVGRKTEDGKDANGKKTTTELLHLKHVVFTYPSYADYMDDLVCKSDIKVYLKASDPFKSVKEACQAKAAAVNK